MKKMILSGIAALFIAIAVAFNVSMNMSERNQLSDFGLANAEALANGEDGIPTIPCVETGPGCTYDCKDGNGTLKSCHTPGHRSV